ncbi:MAG: spore germination protein, partial [Firmicutes bacterium]|nr:spore germination protein [Bacillota bacterium]
RVPKGVGGAFNLLGGLILGGSLVQSNLASPATVLVVAISSVALYLMPEQTNTLRLLRFLFLISSIFMGILGIVISSVLVVVYLSSIDEYGAPYLAPFAPFIGEDQQDALIMKDIHNQKPTTPKSLNRKPKKKTP